MTETTYFTPPFIPSEAPERLPIFVYGTLRPRCGNDRLWHNWAEARYDGEAFVIGRKLTTRGYFPYLVAAATAQTVGALIVPDDEAHPAVLASMDMLEGYPSHYDRIVVAVMTPDGPKRAWTYVPAEHYERAALLPEVPTNDDGFFDWRCAP